MGQSDIRIQIAIDSKTGETRMEALGDKFDKLGRKGKKNLGVISTAARGLKSKLSSLLTSATSLVSVITSGLATKVLYDAGRSFAALETAFESIAGSAERAAEEFQFLRQIGDELGQNFYVLAETYKGYIAAAKETSLSTQQVHDIFRSLIKAAATLHMSGAEVKGMMYAITQMMSKGKVSAEELRRQLGERLYGAFQLAAKAMGVSTAQLDEMLRKGTIMSDVFLPKLAAVLDQKMTGKIDAATRASNKFEESWADLKVEMAKSGFLDSAASALSNIATTFKDEDVKESMRDFAANLGVIAEKLAKLSKYAGLRSIGGTFGQAVQLSKESKLPIKLKEFWRLSFLERQEMVDEVLAQIARENKAWTEAYSRVSFGEPGRSAKHETHDGDDGKPKPKPPPTDRELRDIERAYLTHLRDMERLAKLAAASQNNWDTNTVDLDYGHDELAAAIQKAELKQNNLNLALQRQIDLQNRMEEAVEDTWDIDMGDPYDGLEDDAEEFSDQMVDLSQRTADAMADNFSDFYFNVMRGEFDDLAGYGSGILMSLQRATADYLGQLTRVGLFGSDTQTGFLNIAADWLSNLFIPSAPAGPVHLGAGGTSAFRMAGGGVIGEHVVGYGTRSGASYEFGEQGPEVVTPAGQFGLRMARAGLRHLMPSPSDVIAQPASERIYHHTTERIIERPAFVHLTATEILERGVRPDASPVIDSPIYRDMPATDTSRHETITNTVFPPSLQTVLHRVEKVLERPAEMLMTGAEILEHGGRPGATPVFDSPIYRDMPAADTLRHETITNTVFPPSLQTVLHRVEKVLERPAEMLMTGAEILERGGRPGAAPVFEPPIHREISRTDISRHESIAETILKPAVHSVSRVIERLTERPLFVDHTLAQLLEAPGGSAVHYDYRRWQDLRKFDHSAAFATHAGDQLAPQPGEPTPVAPLSPVHQPVPGHPSAPSHYPVPAVQPGSSPHAGFQRTTAPDPPSVTINFINNSGQPLSARQEGGPRYDLQMKRFVQDVVLEMGSNNRPFQQQISSIRS